MVTLVNRAKMTTATTGTVTVTIYGAAAGLFTVTGEARAGDRFAFWPAIAPTQAPGYTSVAPAQNPGYSPVTPAQVPAWVRVAT